ncbi:MAG: 16S rRNA (adenine(1518)-N(6)/adenine(1519)-N(6))-dimethyltransferase RsmA [Dissulfuribacterales bacterium]
MTSPKTLLSAWNLRPKKQFGQNFLHDPSTARMIVNRFHLSADDVILEIGAGLGALTIPVAQSVKRVYAVEKDDEIARVLKTELSNHDIDNVILLKEDILDVDIAKIGDQEGCKLIVLGNLPYNISSQVIIALIHAKRSIARAVLMFQKEVARRLAAGPGSKDYGRLSVMLQYCADVKKVATIGAHQFLPKPKIASEVIEIRFKGMIADPVIDEVLFSQVIKAAFAKRRKTLKNALSNSELGIDVSGVNHILANAGITPSRRAETLSGSEFVILGNAVFEYKG